VKVRKEKRLRFRWNPQKKQKEEGKIELERAKWYYLISISLKVWSELRNQRGTILTTRQKEPKWRLLLKLVLDNWPVGFFFGRREVIVLVVQLPQSLLSLLLLPPALNALSQYAIDFASLGKSEKKREGASDRVNGVCARRNRHAGSNIRPHSPSPPTDLPLVFFYNFFSSSNLCLYNA